MINSVLCVPQTHLRQTRPLPYLHFPYLEAPRSLALEAFLFFVKPLRLSMTSWKTEFWWKDVRWLTRSRRVRTTPASLQNTSVRFGAHFCITFWKCSWQVDKEMLRCGPHSHSCYRGGSLDWQSYWVNGDVPGTGGTLKNAAASLWDCPATVLSFLLNFHLSSAMFII